MQCKNLIVLATVAIMALTSPAFASPTERGATNPGLQKRDILGGAAGGYLARKAAKKAGVNRLSKNVLTALGAYGGYKLT
ncbi:hypothetical protein IWQ61_002830 [Dispira simplex]|nr:hypothetical protein IWQ61_002830 [Dispira simplex]